MAKKFTEYDFIKNANIVHNNFYDYSLVVYINSRTKIKIICPIHGIFEQIPNNHLSNQGCPECANIIYNNKIIKNFIKSVNKIHNNFYDYSLLNYINNRFKVKIICPIHGIFEQTPKNHLIGCGCPICADTKYSIEEIIEKFNKIHNNFYDYSLVVYINVNTKIKIICPIHGIFEQLPSEHLKGCGCSECYGNKKYTNEEFIQKVDIVHNYVYDYSLINYVNSHTKIKIICHVHGIFEQMPYQHLNGSGCPYCKNSKGENKIKSFLENNNIKYIQQQKFIDCKNKKNLPFDFYLPTKNIAIEFDGEQHYRVVKNWGGDLGFENRKIRDKIKTEYCINNNIQLIRIKYNENIDNKLNIII